MPNRTYLDERDDLDAGAIGKGEAASERDETRSGRHYRECLDSAREELSYEEHLESLDDDLRAYADEPRGSSTKGERDFKRARAEVERERADVRGKLPEDASDEPKKKKRATLEIFWGDEPDGADDLEPLVEGVLHKRTLACIYGPYGVGKSFVGLDLALSIATGEPWFGNQVTRGAVLYVAPEGYVGLKRRRAAWVKHRKLTRTPDNFALVRGSLNLQKPDKVTIETLAAEARDRDAVLIVIDTLNASFGGADENDSAAMSKARHELERLRDLSAAAVLVIHHAGKDVTRGLRGSSVLGGALDTILLVNDGRIISRPPAGKQKDLEAGEDIGFALETVDLGDAITSAIVIPAACKGLKDETMTDDQRQAVAILKRLSERSDVLGPPSRETYRDALKRAAWGPDNAVTWRSRFRNLLDWLQREGVAELDSNGGLIAL